MPTKNDLLYSTALKVIRDLVNDDTVSTYVTRVNLETLRDTIDSYLDSLPNDSEQEEDEN